MSRAPESHMRSIRPYKSGEQYLCAMKEDLAEWLKELYHLEIGPGSFLEALENGVWLCRHANRVTRGARDFGHAHPKLRARIPLPSHGVACNEAAQAGSFQARDNVANFIQWCRKEMGIQEVLMFETEDLVLRKNEKNFILCLLEVARRASRFGLRPPTLVQMEEEIDQEIRQDLDLPPEETPLPQPQREPAHFRNLDQMVQHLVSRCTCPVQFSMIKVSEGKYRVGDSSTLIFVRILRKHVMVRVGGGWDTLEHYLDKHDPCRCTSLSHKQASRMASPRRAQATQVQHEITARLSPRADKPHHSQPTLIVRRSQSPLPPVEWRTYVSRSLGVGGKPPAVPSADEGGKDASSGAPSREHTEWGRSPSSCRARERPPTPSGKWANPGERRSSEEAVFTRGRSEMLHGSLFCPKGVPGPQHRPRTESPQRVPDPWREKGQGLIAAGAPSQKSGTPQPPGQGQRGGKGYPVACPSGTTKPPWTPSPQASAVPAEGLGAGHKRAMASDSQGLLAQRLPTPVNNTGQVAPMDAQASGKASGAPWRPPTPSRGGGCLRNGGDAIASRQGQEGQRSPQKEEGQRGPPGAPRWRFHGVGADRTDREGERTSSEPWGPLERPWRDSPNGGPKAGKEDARTPLPAEQALCQSLEEEILANVKELEATLEEKALPKEGRSGESRESRDLGRDLGPPSASKGARQPPPSLALLQEQRWVVGCAEGVPRSGVYVPGRETRWHPAGARYEDVIQELSTALHREDMAAARGLTPSSSPLVDGTPGEKQVSERKPPCEETTALPEGENVGPPTVEEEGREGLGGSRDPSPPACGSAPNPSEGFSSTPLPPNKPQRRLKKPERVPSIYKLKLRPKIRPRRDHRPEKRPSKIPRPVAYRCGQRPPRAKGQGKALSPKDRDQSSGAKGNPKSTGCINSGGGSSAQGEEGPSTWGESGVPHGEET